MKKANEAIKWPVDENLRSFSSNYKKNCNQVIVWLEHMNTTVSVYTIDIWHATLTGLPYKAPPSSLLFAKYGYYNPLQVFAFKGDLTH